MNGRRVKDIYIQLAGGPGVAREIKMPFILNKDEIDINSKVISRWNRLKPESFLVHNIISISFSWGVNEEILNRSDT